MKRRILSVLVSVLLVLSSFSALYADNTIEATYVNYCRLKEVYDEVFLLFPDTPIDNIMSYEEYCEEIRGNNSEIQAISNTVTDTYIKTLDNGDKYTLEIYDDGTFSLTSIKGFWDGVSWVSNSGSTYTFGFTHILATAIVSAEYSAIRYYTHGSYRFNNLTFVSSTYCTYYSLGYYGGTYSQAAFYGSCVEFNDSIGDYVEFAKLRLRGIVNPSTGDVSVEHLYVPYFGY